MKAKKPDWGEGTINFGEEFFAIPAEYNYGKRKGKLYLRRKVTANGPTEELLFNYFEDENGTIWE